jgi:thiosulfate/3-mercaptopyruvate sulfurtransferase
LDPELVRQGRAKIRPRWALYVTYCTIGNRASLVWFALRHVLGFRDVAVYYGSWIEWGKLPGTPVERS